MIKIPVRLSVHLEVFFQQKLIKKLNQLQYLFQLDEKLLFKTAGMIIHSM